MRKNIKQNINTIPDNQRGCVVIRHSLVDVLQPQKSACFGRILEHLLINSNLHKYQSTFRQRCAIMVVINTIALTTLGFRTYRIHPLVGGTIALIIITRVVQIIISFVRMIVIERFIDCLEQLPVLYLVLVAVQIIYNGIDE